MAGLVSYASSDEEDETQDLLAQTTKVSHVSYCAFHELLDQLADSTDDSQLNLQFPFYRR